MTNLQYRDSDNRYTELKGCTLTQGKCGRYWLWSEELQHNLAYKAPTREDCFLAAIASLLFTIKLRDERIVGLQYIATLAQEFADHIKPNEVR